MSIAVAGLDVVRDADGILRVLEDNVRTPSGITYMLAARESVEAALPGELVEMARPLDGTLGLLAADADAGGVGRPAQRRTGQHAPGTSTAASPASSTSRS